MIRTIFTLLLITIALNCGAQRIEKRYSSYLSEKGTINFFRPKKLDKKVNADKFIFDMTYISKHDSITINCLVATNSGGVAKEFNLKSGERNISGEAVSTLFRDVVKNGFAIRITSRFLIKDIKESFYNQKPLIFNITLTDGTTCMATYKPSKWKKESLQITRILESINY